MEKQIKELTIEDVLYAYSGKRETVKGVIRETGKFYVSPLTLAESGLKTPFSLNHGEVKFNLTMLQREPESNVVNEGGKILRFDSQVKGAIRVRKIFLREGVRVPTLTVLPCGCTDECGGHGEWGGGNPPYTPSGRSPAARRGYRAGSSGR